VLGIPLLFQVPGMPMAFFASGDVRLYLGVPESPEFRSKVVLYFTVTDIDAEYERLRDQHGVSFTGEPHVVHRDASGELWMTFTRDPDDHWIGLMQQRAASFRNDGRSSGGPRGTRRRPSGTETTGFTWSSP